MDGSMIITDSEEIRLVEHYRNGYRGIYWHVEDFEQQAQIKEDAAIDVDPNIELPLYDRDFFQDALERMIYKHDANEGINWYTIDYYLDSYCKIKE